MTSQTMTIEDEVRTFRVWLEDNTYEMVRRDLPDVDPYEFLLFPQLRDAPPHDDDYKKLCDVCPPLAAYYAKFDVAGVEMCGVHFGDAGTVFETATQNWMAPWPNPTDKFVVGDAEDAYNLCVDLDGVVWFRDFDEHTAGGFHYLADSMEGLLSRLIRRFMEVGNEPLVWAHRLERLSRTVLEQLDDEGRLLAPSVEEPLPRTEDEFFATARRLSWREAFYLPSLQQADLRHALQNGPPGKTKLKAPLAYVDEDGEVVAVFHVDEDEDRRLFVRRGA